MLGARLDRVEKILCLGAHADDIEIGCGGTVLKLLAANTGIEVHWVVLSAAGEREEEAVRSAERFLGDAYRHTVIVKDFRDAFFPYHGAEIKEYIHELSEEFSPDLVLTHRREDLHQDHCLVAGLTWNAFRNHLIMEYEIAKYEGDLGRPNVFVELSSELCEQKVNAILESFKSQANKQWFSADTFRSLLRLRGLECNSPSKFAEGLYCRKLVL